MEEILLREEYHVEMARATAKAVAVDMGFSTSAIGQIALAISEICQNVIRYGEEGKIQFTTRNKERVLKIVVQDKGPGIPNIEQYMQDGFSTTNSLGVGLMAAKRSVDFFDIQSNEAGTTVTLEKHLPLTKDLFEFGVVSLPDANYVVNGDTYVVKPFDGDKVLLAVIDGLGQGKPAFQMAKAVKEVIEANYFLPIEKIIALCHQRLQSPVFLEGGVAMSIALLSPETIQYIGVGDTHAHLLNPTIHFLLNIDGRVGEQILRSLVTRTFPTQEDQILILCTDGIQSQLDCSTIDPQMNLQGTTIQLFNAYNRPYGDATILVAKYKKASNEL